MPHPSNFRGAAELLKIILTGTSPADVQMDRYFRARGRWAYATAASWPRPYTAACGKCECW